MVAQFGRYLFRIAVRIRGIRMTDLPLNGDRFAVVAIHEVRIRQYRLRRDRAARVNFPRQFCKTVVGWQVGQISAADIAVANMDFDRSQFVNGQAAFGECLKLQLCRMEFLGSRHIHTSLSLNAAGSMFLSEILEKSEPTANQSVPPLPASIEPSRGISQ